MGPTETKQSQSSQSVTNQNGTSQLSAYKPAGDILNGLLGSLGGTSPDLSTAETNAINGLISRSPSAGQFAPDVNSLARDLFAGGGPDRSGMLTSAYDKFSGALEPYLKSPTDPRDNPALMRYLDVSGEDARSKIAQEFAGAGRDLSGLDQQAQTRGITQAQAPILYDAYNTGADRAINAATGLLGGATSTTSALSGLDQTRLANRGAGIDVANQATAMQNAPDLQVLQAEAMRRGIPLQALAQEMGIVLPTATAFGTTNTSQNGVTNGTAQGTTSTQVPLGQQLLGGAIGLTGLLGSGGAFGGAGAFGSSGLLGKLGSGAFNLFGGPSKSPALAF